jgi:hypothetical protein
MTIQLITRDELRTELANKVATIEFEKTDGTLRTMKCTLQASFLPPLPVLAEGEEKPEKKVRAINDNVVAVWDVDVGEWRSFRVNSIRSILYHA